jgi:hypothetical protein
MTYFPQALLRTIIDAKGDIIAGTAADVAARVAVAADGAFIRAKASASPGVEWDVMGSFTYWEVDKPPTSADADDDEFEDASGQSGPINGLDAKWSWLNQGTSTISFTHRKAKIAVQTGASTNIRGIKQVIAGGTPLYSAKLCLGNVSFFTNDNRVMIGLYNSVNGRLMTIGLRMSGGTSVVVEALKWTNTTTINTTLASMPIALVGGPAYFSIGLSGTNLLARFSHDGTAWLTFIFEALATFIGTPTDVGIFGCCATASQTLNAECEWFRLANIPGADVTVIME